MPKTDQEIIQAAYESALQNEFSVLVCGLIAQRAGQYDGDPWARFRGAHGLLVAIRDAALKEVGPLPASEEPRE
jgi:hypothetical protein